MLKPYDVFETVDGANVWIGAAGSLSEAIQLVGRHGTAETGRYLIYSQELNQRTYFEKQNQKIVQVESTMSRG